MYLNSFLSFFWSDIFRMTITMAIVSAFCLVLLKRLANKALPKSTLKIVYGIIFLPVIMLPVFKCCFKVPYVFCRQCPSKCPWGISRTFLLGSFISLNLFGRFWCFSMCPLGAFREYRTKISKKIFGAASSYSLLPYATLLLTGWMYSLTFFSSQLLAFFSIGRYEWVPVTITVAAVIAAVSLFVPGFWCRYLCPVGTIAVASDKAMTFRR